MTHYELDVELHQVDEDEALAVARDLSKRFAAPVTVTQVTPGRTFADGASRLIIQTVEPAA